MKTKKVFCKVCNKETLHSLQPDGKTWMCDNAHQHDGRCCHICGKELGDEALDIAKALGVNQIVCKECRKGKKIKIAGGVVLSPMVVPKKIQKYKKEEE